MTSGPRSKRVRVIYQEDIFLISNVNYMCSHKTKTTGKSEIIFTA